MRIQGLDKVLKSLEFDESKLQNAVREAGSLVEQTARNNLVADSRKHIDQDAINIVKTTLNSHDVKDGDFIGVNIGTNENMGAYIEFGTGKHVVVPIETTSEYTMRWFKNGKGTIDDAPWLFPAWRDNRSKIYNIIKKGLELK